MKAPEKQCAVCGATFAKPPSDSKRTWAKRKCCTYSCSVEIRRGRPNPKVAAANRGRKRTLEQIAKHSAIMRRLHAEGKVRNARVNLGLRREQTSQWKGDDIKYRGAHLRLDRERGRPAECEHCGTTTARKFEWALRHDAEVCLAEPNGRFAGFDYSPRSSDYIRLCTACHQEYDGREHDPRTGCFL